MEVVLPSIRLFPIWCTGFRYHDYIGIESELSMVWVSHGFISASRLGCHMGLFAMLLRQRYYYLAGGLEVILLWEGMTGSVLHVSGTLGLYLFDENWVFALIE